MLPGSVPSRGAALRHSDKTACSCRPPRSPRTLLTWQWLTDLAAFSGEALRTVAAVAVTFLQTAASVQTGVSLAWVLLHCKHIHGEGGRGGAFKRVISVHYGKKRKAHVDTLNRAMSLNYAASFSIHLLPPDGDCVGADPPPHAQSCLMAQPPVFMEVVNTLTLPGSNSCCVWMQEGWRYGVLIIVLILRERLWSGRLEHWLEDGSFFLLFWGQWGAALINSCFMFWSW